MPNDFCKNGDAWVEFPFSFRTALKGAALADGAILDSLDLRVESVSECPYGRASLRDMNNVAPNNPALAAFHN